MKPLVAIVGRPNVGKSTFFNRMIGERVAIVEDRPGTTRDRIYGDTDWNGRDFTLIDTGGLELGTDIPVGQVGLNGQPGDIMKRVQAQAQLAIEEADVIVFMVDARTGITAADEEVAEMLRRTNKPVILAANKADNAARRLDAVEFYTLGLGEPITVSSIQGTGTGDLLDVIVDALPPEEERPEEEEDEDVVRVAIVGRPNVGKSSLLNAILGFQRSIVSDVPGTTRDAIDIEMEFEGKKVILIDTAGIRRRGRVGPGVEKYSVLRASRAIDRCAPRVRGISLSPTKKLKAPSAIARLSRRASSLFPMLRLFLLQQKRVTMCNHCLKPYWALPRCVSCVSPLLVSTRPYRMRCAAIILPLIAVRCSRYTTRRRHG